jgi:hypothetical protein
VTWARSRAIVAAFGCPYGVVRADRNDRNAGPRVASSASDDAVALPWWATLSMSTVGRPRLSRIGSTSSSASPVSRKRRTLVLAQQNDRSVVGLAVVVALGSRKSGRVVPSSGHSTRRWASSSAASRPWTVVRPTCRERPGCLPGSVGGSVDGPSRLEGAPDAVAVDHGHQPAYMVVMGMGQDHGVEAAIPERECSDPGPAMRTAGSGPPSTRMRPAAVSFEQDRVALARRRAR